MQPPTHGTPSGAENARRVAVGAFVLLGVAYGLLGLAGVLEWLRIYNETFGPELMDENPVYWYGLLASRAAQFTFGVVLAWSGTQAFRSGARGLLIAAGLALALMWGLEGAGLLDREFPDGWVGVLAILSGASLAVGSLAYASRNRVAHLVAACSLGVAAVFLLCIQGFSDLTHVQATRLSSLPVTDEAFYSMLGWTTVLAVLLCAAGAALLGTRAWSTPFGPGGSLIAVAAVVFGIATAVFTIWRLTEYPWESLDRLQSRFKPSTYMGLAGLFAESVAGFVVMAAGAAALLAAAPRVDSRPA